MFSRSSHVFINENNVCIERPKYNVYERKTNKKMIKEFEEKREGKRSKWITEKRIDGWENVLKFNTIYE
jgi:hypothetical protein